jgi:hypothetical protein
VKLQLVRTPAEFVAMQYTGVAPSGNTEHGGGTQITGRLDSLQLEAVTSKHTGCPAGGLHSTITFGGQWMTGRHLSTMVTVKLQLVEFPQLSEAVQRTVERPT